MNDEIKTDHEDPNGADVNALRCADCARSDSLVTDLAPTSSLPIPVEAMDGLPRRRPDAKTTARGGLDRRQFLRNGLVGVASVYSATQLDWSSIWEAAVAEAAEPMQKSIVCIFLNGGNDGLNTIVPVEATRVRRLPGGAHEHRPRASARRPGRRSARP